MIQDIGEHIYDNHFEPHEAGPGSYLLHYVGDTMLCKLDDGGFCLPRLADLASAPSLRYLFSIDGTGFFLILDETVDAPGFSYAPVNWTRDAEPRHLLFAAVTGWQLARWYEANRFCGRCGHPTEIVPPSREICCPECGMVIYPKIAPGVIVAIIDPATERIVLTKYAGRPQVHYALVAGFTEIGETFEQTVQREVAEEVGLTVGRVRYWADQPWPFSGSILAGFWCEVEGSCEFTVDHGELKCAVWLTRDEVPMPRRDTSSLTNAMITAFATGYDPYR